MFIKAVLFEQRVFKLSRDMHLSCHMEGLLLVSIEVLWHSSVADKLPVPKFKWGLLNFNLIKKAGP